MAEARRPQPPPRRGTPGLVELEPARWWRVHPYDAVTGRYLAQQFNDSGAGNARFSPLLLGGRPVPTLYAAETLDAALMETVLHDVPYPSEGYLHDLERDLRGPLHASQIAVVERLTVVDLTKLGLQRMGIRPSQMFETDADDYPRTRRWAEYLHQACEPAQGLLGMSARQPEARALMLFGDRAGGAVESAPGGTSRPLRAAPVLEALLALLDRLGCGVAPDR